MSAFDYFDSELSLTDAEQNSVTFPQLANFFG
jgi:hypothetical protein